MMKRRDALKTLGALAGAGAAARFLPGCSDEDSGPGEITHVVALMLENRTYDHVLGARSMLGGKPGNGLTAGMFNLDAQGKRIEIYPAPSTYDKGLCVPDPPHGWAASHRQFADGANSGFVLEHQADHPGDVSSMQYLTSDHMPVTWALADAYTSCDRWFASLMGPTIPNRMYWHSASSDGIDTNTPPRGGVKWKTIYDSLNDKGIEWAYYYGDAPILAAVDRLVEGDRLRDFQRFFGDAKAGKLPPVTYIDPSFAGNDDHPPHHPFFGQQLIASIYTALTKSPHWNSCMFVITYDEHGGFFDHVPPPKIADDFAATGFDQLGFRVPALVVGPWVKAGVVSTEYNHASLLRFIETKYDLPTLNKRTAASNPITDCLDLERLAAGDPLPIASIPAVEIDASMLDAQCEAGGVATADYHPAFALFDSLEGRHANLDRRAQLRDTLYMIGDYLDENNVGRIRRGR